MHLSAGIENFITFRQLVPMFCFPFDNVHRQLQRLTTNKRCHREESKPTGNPRKWALLSAQNEK